MRPGGLEMEEAADVRGLRGGELASEIRARLL